jgi:methionyl-tRNA formyltransferase
MESGLKCVFMGTPEIAVASLRAMVESGYRPVAIVTVPDRTAGRGLKLQVSPVKQFAINNGIFVLQPDDLSDAFFLQQVRELKPDIIVVVAFRKLPKALIEIPTKGAFNLHASLLPQYRGAAPINWAIINGETETGVTTFLLDQNIDTGKILYQEKVQIPLDQTASELHDILMENGAMLVIKTLRSIESGEYQAFDQCEYLSDQPLLKKAPKIFKENCRINWKNGAADIYNFIRGLCLYPGAYTDLVSPENVHYYIRILTSSYEIVSINVTIGSLETDGVSYLRIAVVDGYVYLKRVQMAGKKLMNIDEFLRGFKVNNDWSV